MNSLSKMEQLLAFCDWERQHNSHAEGKPHIAEWAYTEIVRLTSELHVAIQRSTRDAQEAALYRWLRDHAHETPMRPSAFNSEIAPDTRLRWDFPTLVSFDCIGQQISLDEAIRIAIEGDSA